MSFKDEQYFDQRPNGLSGNPMTKQDDAKDSYLREQVNSRLFADDFPILNDIESIDLRISKQAVIKYKN